jgi:hypothetical protein
VFEPNPPRISDITTVQMKDNFLAQGFKEEEVVLVWCEGREIVEVKYVKARHNPSQHPRSAKLSRNSISRNESPKIDGVGGAVEGRVVHERQRSMPCLSLSRRECDRQTGGIAYRVNDSHNGRTIISGPGEIAESRNVRYCSVGRRRRTAL